MKDITLENIYFQPLSHAKLTAYLDRIAYTGSLLPSVQLLEDLHMAHVTAICFENIHPFLNLPLSVALDDIFNKMVLEKRGGYCFEHNLLFASVLLKLGFRLEMLTARVLFNTTPLPPRTHMLLQVHADNRTWLADVGFGTKGILLPLVMEPEFCPRYFAGRTFRVEPRGRFLVLQSIIHNTWTDLYIFSMEPQEWIDYKMANHYVSTHPDSKFTQMLILQIHTKKSQIILKGNEIIETRGELPINKTFLEKESIAEQLRRVFHLNLSLEMIRSLQNVIFPS
ncbi:arylamine N-acetyltransferase family protein [Desulfocicer niacini]